MQFQSDSQKLNTRKIMIKRKFENREIVLQSNEECLTLSSKKRWNDRNSSDLHYA